MPMGIDSNSFRFTNPIFTLIMGSLFYMGAGKIGNFLKTFFGFAKGSFPDGLISFGVFATWLQIARSGFMDIFEIPTLSLGFLTPKPNQAQNSGIPN